MKRAILLGMAAIPALLYGQTPAFTVKGTVGKYNAPAKVYLMYPKGPGQSVTDSSALVNGQFTFKGAIAEPVMGILVLDSKGVGIGNIRPDSRPDLVRFYLEKGDIVVSAADSLSKANVTGKNNADNKKLQALLEPAGKKMAALNNEFQASSPEQKQSEEYRNGMQKKYEAIVAEQNVILKDFIKKNPSSFVSVTAVQQLAEETAEPTELEALIGKLSPELRNSASLEPVKAGLASLKKTAIGVQAMDFTQNDTSGKPVKLSDFKGKYVLLDFWASWCGPCRQENPNVVKAYNKYKGKNFTVLGISLDRENGKEAWLKAIKDDGLTWTQVSDLKFWQNEVAVLYGIRSIPKNYLLDPSGKIIATDLRGPELEKKLAEVLD